MKRPYLQDAGKLDGSGPEWLRELRSSALARFRETGFPTTRMEEWRNTDVGAIAETPFRVPLPVRPGTLEKDRVRSASLSADGGTLLVFVNGGYRPELSRNGTSGVAAGSVTEHADDLRPELDRHASNVGNAFTALNTALFRDGAFVRVEKGARPERPIHLLFLTAPEDAPILSPNRVLVLAEPGSEARIIEEHAALGKGAYFNTCVTELSVGEAARLRHYKIQREGPDAFHVGAVAARLGRDSLLATHSISFGASLARNDMHVALDGEGAECVMNGLYVLGGRQLTDHHTVIEHRKPHTSSRELFKGVLDDRSRGVFNGRIVVRPDAQKVDAEQENRNLLLSRSALANSNPQLEIFADDVKCRHGSTIGQLDERELFYLRSRGIDAREARAILVYAFASDIVERMADDAIRTALRIHLHRMMG